MAGESYDECMWLVRTMMSVAGEDYDECGW